LVEEYLNIFNEYRAVIDKNSSEALNSLRDGGAAALEKLDFTTFKDEYAIDLGLNFERYTIQNNPYKLFSCDIPNIGAYIFYIVNDTFYSNPQCADLPNGVIISSLKEASVTHNDLVKRYLGKQMSISSDANQALNAMLAQDGLFVYIPKGVELDRPIQLVNLMYGKSPIMAVSHNLVILDEGSKAQLLVCDHSIGGVDYLSNRVTEVFACKNSVYDHYKVENSSDKMTNICSLLIDQKEGSEVVSNIITLNNNKTLNTIKASLSESHSNLSLCGMCFLDGKQFVSNESEILHKTSDTSSFESFKYILDDESKGNFYGMIKVLPDAQRSKAIQTNKNICLSNNAQMKTKPQLEIYADDVKCNHGATVGQLDETSMFYMLSRGISKDEAKMLLMSAFVYDVLEKVRISSLKDRLKLLIEKRLRKEDSRCASCGTCNTNL